MGGFAGQGFPHKPGEGCVEEPRRRLHRFGTKVRDSILDLHISGQLHQNGMRGFVADVLVGDQHAPRLDLGRDSDLHRSRS